MPEAEWTDMLYRYRLTILETRKHVREITAKDEAEAMHKADTMPIATGDEPDSTELGSADREDWESVMMMFCDENFDHGDNKNAEPGFKFQWDITEPQPCLSEGCQGLLWLNRECQHWDRGSYFAPPEACGRPTAPGHLYCPKHPQCGEERR
jgi:hypothetical protein